MCRPARLAGIDGLRGLAAISIIIYHVWRYGSPDGRVELGAFSRFVIPHLPAGVVLFFTLSGFLLYRPLAAAVLRGTPRPDLREYLRGRALRILPAYWAILLATCVVLPASLIRTPSSDLTLGTLAREPGLLARNILLLQNYFPDAFDTGIGPAWTLAIEVVFYLSLPALGWLAAACAGNVHSDRRITLAALVPVALLLATGVAHKAAAAYLASPDGYLDMMLKRSFWYRADLFAFGMALAVLHVRVEDGRVGLPRWSLRATTAAFGFVVVSTVALADRGLLWRWPAINPYETLQMLAAVLLLALVVLPYPSRRTPSAFCRALETRPLVWAGLISYSLYLWHEPLIRWLELHRFTLAGSGGYWFNLGVVLVISGLLSALTYHYVERPALAVKGGPGRAGLKGLSDDPRAGVPAGLP